MPELDKLAKLIVHRQNQEKKNDRLRIHKNKIENDKLKVQIKHLDWNKVLRGREMANVEEIYMRRFEKIYNRRKLIEQKRIEEEKKKEEERQAKKRSLEENETNKQTKTIERRRQLHGTKQEVTKVFMEKAKSLSGCYRDNDPPQSYYKRKGLVPPDKMVTPDITAQTQADRGGGWRVPSSSEHLHKSRLPEETPHGIKSTSQSSFKKASHRESAARSESISKHSVASDKNLMPYNHSTEEDNDDDAFVDQEVIRVEIRPCTAPSKRLQKANNKCDVLVTKQLPNNDGHKENLHCGVEPEIQQIEVRKPKRPATAAAYVHFAGNVKNSNIGAEKNKSPMHSTRRRGSIMPPTMMMFHKRASSAEPRGRPGSIGTKTRNQRNDSKSTLMTNEEQDRIRQKIQEKAECLYRERLKRIVVSLMSAQGETVPRRIRSANSPRELPFYYHYLRNADLNARNNLRNEMQNAKITEEMNTMMSYLKECQEKDMMADTNQAKDRLLEATNVKNTILRKGVQSFVKSK